MPTYSELLSQIAILEKEAQAARQSEITAVVADIKAKMSEFGISVADLGMTRGKKGRVFVAKYRDPATGKTWSGQGKHPRWLAEAIARGAAKDSFLI